MASWQNAPHSLTLSHISHLNFTNQCTRKERPPYTTNGTKLWYVKSLLLAKFNVYRHNVFWYSANFMPTHLLLARLGMGMGMPLHKQEQLHHENICQWILESQQTRMPDNGNASYSMALHCSPKYHASCPRKAYFLAPQGKGKLLQ